MNYPLAELLDRYVIVCLKWQNQDQTQELRDELCAFTVHINSEFPWVERAGWQTQLQAVHAEIWKLESDIRRGREHLLGLEEVGKRALAIRDWNKKRIEIKNEIARAKGGFVEVKHDHASA